jgi:hypothetical protein
VPVQNSRKHQDGEGTEEKRGVPQRERETRSRRDVLGTRFEKEGTAAMNKEMIDLVFDNGFRTKRYSKVPRTLAVEAFVRKSGLAIHRVATFIEATGEPVYHKDWAITHVKSGMRAVPVNFQTKKEAIDKARILEAFADKHRFSWHLYMEEIKLIVPKETLKEFSFRIRQWEKNALDGTH